VTAASFRAFGKLPSHSDFLQFGATSAAFTRFDDWLTESVEWAHARGGQAFRSAFQGSGIRAFVYAPETANQEMTPIIGALAPSRDVAGRLFPLSIAASPVVERGFLGDPQLLPLACEEIWQSANRCLLELLPGEMERPAAFLAALTAPSLFPFSEAQASYSEWSNALPLTELWSLISNSGPARDLQDTLRWIAEAVRPHRQREPPGTRLALRLPLGQAGGAAVCFWLDVVRRLIAWRRTVPSFFWSHDGRAGELTVHLGAPASSSIAELWLPTRTRDEVCDLTSMSSAPSGVQLAPLPAAIELALAGQTSVAAFLARLGAD
jgi:type VI secretion system ImpM family protein